MNSNVTISKLEFVRMFQIVAVRFYCGHNNLHHDASDIKLSSRNSTTQLVGEAL